MITSYIQSHKRWIFIYGIMAFLTLFSTMILWKWYHLQYNELDLAIFANVLYNSIYGDFWFNSVQSTYYLADHLTPLLLILLPVYILITHPLLLVFLQLGALCVAAILLYIVTHQVTQKEWVGLFFTGLFLLHYSVQDMALNGFHLLPFAMPLFFLLHLFYIRGDYKKFIITLVALLCIREDVAIVTAMYSFVPLLDRRSKKWWLVPFTISIAYFVLALKITGLFNTEGSYKFLVYYSWLGSSASEIIWTIIRHPVSTMRQLITIPNAELLIGLIMPFLGLPLLRPKYLIPIIGILATHLLSGGGSLILQAHYSALMVPFLFIASIYAFNSILLRKRDLVQITVVILCVGFVYTNYFLGPIKVFVQEFFIMNKNSTTAVKRDLLYNIGVEDSVVASSAFLPSLASRLQLYSLHYVFLGNKQFSSEAYVLPEVDSMIFDSKEFITYNLQAQDGTSFTPIYNEGSQRVRNVIQEQGLSLESVSDSTVVLSKSGGSDLLLYDRLHMLPREFDEFTPLRFGDRVDLVGMNVDREEKRLGVGLYFKPQDDTLDTYVLKILFSNNDNEVYTVYYPLAYGLYPSHEWKRDEYIYTYQDIYIPQRYQSDTLKIEGSLVTLDGSAYFTTTGTVKQLIRNEKNVGTFTIIGE